MVDEVLARSFETSGADYDRYRPGFPPAAVEIMVPSRVDTALDLGAGTGKFTRLLLDRAETVIAVEPSAAMLDVLRANLPDVDARAGGAEAIPCSDESVDVVTVAQAFHWFDRDPACAEIARVLVPGGRLGLLWNRSDPACAWDVAAHRVAHPAVRGTSDDATSSSAADDPPGFVFERHDEVRWRETMTRESYLARWRTVSTFLVADDETERRMLEHIEAILDADPDTRGRREFDVPHVTDVYAYRRA
ncbi:class I SAM-dependent methyltransferase [Microbacterium maritypicum]